MNKSVAPHKAKNGPANPFKGYQDKVVSAREEAIGRYLSWLRRTRGKYEYVTDLAKAVSEQIEMAEGAPCSYTTLLRNKRYKALLLNFMAMRPGIDSIQVSEPAAQALIHTAELELGNVKRDNERLRNRISELEAKLNERPSDASTPKINLDSPEMLNQLSNERALACKALWLVLEHFNELVSIDTNRSCIIDLAATERKNVIVGADTVKPFIEWLRSNNGIG